MNEFPVQEHLKNHINAASYYNLPSSIHSQQTIKFPNGIYQDYNMSSKSVNKPFTYYNQSDFLIVKEVLEHAYASYIQDSQKDPNAKLDSVRLLVSYEIILKKYGIDPLQDGYFYKLIVKLENNKSGDLFLALEKEICKNNEIQISYEHYERCLKAKSFFALVSNMVSSKMALSARSNQSQKSQKSIRSTADKENFNQQSHRKIEEELRTQQLPLQDHSNQNLVHSQTQSGKSLKRLKGRQTGTFQNSNSSSGQNTYQNTINLNSKKAITTQQSYANSQVLQLQALKLKQNQSQENRIQTKSKQAPTYCTSENADLSSQIDNNMHLQGKLENTGSVYNQNFKSLTGTLKSVQVEKTPKDFRILLKTLRTWKNFIECEKKRKVEEQKHLKLWAVSIHFHEQTLLTKSFLGIKGYQIKQKALYRNQSIVTCMREIKTRQKFFSKWMKTHKGFYKRKELIYKALNHWGNRTTSKVLLGWKEKVLFKKHEKYVTLQKLMEKPASIVCLLDFINNGKKQPQWSNLKQLKQILMNQFKIQDQQFLLYLLNGISRFYQQQAFRGLALLTFNARIKLQNAGIQRPRYILKRLKQFFNKKLYHKQMQQKLSQQLNQKRVWSIFALWLNATTNVLIHKDLKEKSEFFREKTLKFKVMRGLLTFLNQKQTLQSYMTLSVNSNMNRLIAKTFQGWKFIAVYNKKPRALLKQGQHVHQQSLKSQYFMKWLTTALQAFKAKQQYQKSLQRKVFKLLLVNLEHIENQIFQHKLGKQHYKSNLIRKILNDWVAFTKESRKERYLRKTVFKYMQVFKQKQVLRALNDECKKQKAETEIKSLAHQNFKYRSLKMAFFSLQMNKSYNKEIRVKQIQLTIQEEQRIKSSAYIVWFGAFKKRILEKRCYNKIKETNLVRTLTEAFARWQILHESKRVQRTNFFRGRAYNLFKKAFTNLRVYTFERSTFRQKLRNFLKLRASNLLKLSIQSLYSYSKETEVYRKFKKVSAYIFLEKTLRKCFLSFKTIHTLSQNFKKVQFFHSKYQAHQYLQIWKMKYLRKDIVKRLRTRSSTKMQHFCLILWKQFLVKQNINSDIINIGLHKYATRLQNNSFKQFQKYISYRRNKKVRLIKTYYDYLEKQSKICFLHWAHHSFLRKQTLNLVYSVRQKRDLLNKFRTFISIKDKSNQLKFRREKTEPFKRNKSRKLQRQCLLQLYKYGFKRTLIKSNLQKFMAAKLSNTYKTVFESLHVFKNKKQNLKEQNKLADKVRNLSLVRRTMYCLVKNKVFKEYISELMVQRDFKQRTKFFYQWTNTYKDELISRPLDQQADIYFKKKALQLFQQRVKSIVVERLTKQHFKRKSYIHLQTQQKQRGIKQLFKFSQINKLQRMKKVLSIKVYLRKTFDSWRYNINSLRESKLRNRKQLAFRESQLIIKGFRSLILRHYQAQTQQLKIQVCQEQKNLIIKKKVIAALLDNCDEQISLRGQMIKKIAFLGAKNLRPWFKKWIEFNRDHQKEELALLYRNQRGSQFLIRKVMDHFKIGLLKASERRLKSENAKIVYQRNLQQVFLNIFRSVLYRQQTYKEIARIITEKRESRLITSTFINMVECYNSNKHEGDLNIKSQEFLAVSLFKKSLLALQKNQCYGQIQKVIQARQNLSKISSSLTQWKLSYMRSATLTIMSDKLQRKHDRLMGKQFYQRLVKLGFYQQIYETLESKRMIKYSNTFIQLLKRNLIYKQIVKGFQFAKDQQIKRKTLIGLLSHREDKLNNRTIIETQLEIVQEENDIDLLRSVFNSFKKYILYMRCKKIARNFYVIGLFKKSISSFHLFTMKNKLQKYATYQIQSMQASRYLRNWNEAVDRKRQQDVANSVVQSHQLSIIFNTWKQIANKQKAAKIFNYFKSSQNLKPLVFTALIDHANRQKYLRMCEHEIRQNRDFQIMKEYLLQWMDQNNLRKISLNMQRFHNFKLLKTVCDEWRGHTYYKNDKRQQVIEVKTQLMKKPQLIKPLVVLKNFTLFKAFRALSINTQESRQENLNNEKSGFAFYLRLIRKGFYSMKIYNHNKFQRRKVKQIKLLFLQRRWFLNLKNAVLESKRERKMRTESVIFNFLNIQRKAFQMILSFASNRQQIRIKAQFAEELYYKRLADKVFLGLKLNITEKQPNKTILTQNKSLLNPFKTKSSNRYLMNQSNMSKKDQSNMDQSIMGQSRFDVEVSNMQLECSTIFDFEEKSKLVYELYCKKLMFKCFAGWSNISMCVSEEEDKKQMNETNYENDDDQYSSEDDNEYSQEDEEEKSFNNQ